MPIPQILSLGLASTKMRSPVFTKNSRNALFCSNLPKLPRITIGDRYFNHIS